jgi:predicted PhzF superfamily epimerase YddE/YHI9
MERLEPGRNAVVFHTASGALAVARTSAAYAMDFPARPSRPAPAPAGLARGLGVDPIAIEENEFNYLAVVESEAAVRSLAPDFAALACLDRPGVIVTAICDGTYDFVSRYFAPKKGIPEDPVTGGAHCTLAPYWAAQLGKTELRGFQASQRGGEVVCRVAEDRVQLVGKCAFYLEGEVEVHVDV